MTRWASLARRAGWRFSLMVSVGVLLSHVLFAYAQYSGKDMDCVIGRDGATSCTRDQLGYGLIQGKVSAAFDYQAKGTLADVAQLAAEELCYSKGRFESCPDGQLTRVLPSMAVEDDACTALECGGLTFGETALAMSYWYSIENLRDHSISVFQRTNFSSYCDGPEHRPFPKGPCGYYYQVYPGDPAAVALFSFSFVWPHVK